LISRVAQGDKDAFTLLFHAYKDKLFSFVHDITGSTAKAEDIVQEVFLKIWEKQHHLSQIDNFNAYLFRMCRNYAIDQFRKLNREILLHSSLLQQDNISMAGADEAVLQKELRQKLQEAVDQLPPQQKRVFILHKEKGFKLLEIAEELDLSVSTVQNHLFRAVGNIRHYLNTMYPDISLYIMLAMAPWFFL
jgi:RNA polymerase sigma-70 factor (ECF subfamily)